MGADTLPPLSVPSSHGQGSRAPIRGGPELAGPLAIPTGSALSIAEHPAGMPAEPAETSGGMRRVIGRGLMNLGNVGKSGPPDGGFVGRDASEGERVGLSTLVSVGIARGSAVCRHRAE